MRKKCMILAVCCLVLALAIFAFSYCLFHYLSPDGGFDVVRQAEPAKPMVTWLFAIWGVTFLFASVMSALVGIIFFNGK